MKDMQLEQDRLEQDHLAQEVRKMLDQRVAEPDELTRAALRAARYRALDALPEHSSWWSGLWSGLRSGWSAAAIGATCAVLIAWQLQAPPSNLGVSVQTASNQTEDAAVIADLDLVMWLEDSDV